MFKEHQQYIITKGIIKIVKRRVTHKVIYSSSSFFIVVGVSGYAEVYPTLIPTKKIATVVTKNKVANVFTIRDLITFIHYNIK